MRVGDDIVEVELEGVGAGLGDHATVLDPAAARVAVEGAEHRHLDDLFRPPDALEVLGRADDEVVRVGEVVVASPWDSAWASVE